MIETQVREQPRQKSVAGPKSITGKVAAVQAAVPAHAKIRERAYELYKGRSCEPGQDAQDWFRAEQETSGASL
jgi:Protein of unknown function (DUF2934)